MKTNNRNEKPKQIPIEPKSAYRRIRLQNTGEGFCLKKTGLEIVKASLTTSPGGAKGEGRHLKRIPRTGIELPKMGNRILNNLQ